MIPSTTTLLERQQLPQASEVDFSRSSSAGLGDERMRAGGTGHKLTGETIVRPTSRAGTAAQ